MAGENEKPKSDASAGGAGKPKKRKYLPHARPARKGSYPLHPRVEGFFITCDGGRERQAANDALSLLDTFYEELTQGKSSETKSEMDAAKPVNKITKFSDSESSDSEENSDVENANGGELSCEADDTSAKKQRTETEPVRRTEEKHIDALIEDELKDLGDRKKRHFVTLDSGCNGCIFIQMNKGAGDPSPSSIAQHMMSSLASSRKHVSRFILRVLPTEVSCYASVDEITKEIKPLIAQYFPEDSSTPLKYAVLYEARANSGIDRKTIIDTVAKSVPEPHKVDLTNPDKTIIVEIVKTICLIGVVEKYKELSKYNVRQLTIQPKKTPDS
ncbi:THUMP domain-containing protein [Wolffia australiana]